MVEESQSSADRAARVRRVPALTRAVAILRHLGRSESPLGVNQIARDVKLIPSTCLHILRALVDEGLVAVDEETKRYSLGIGILPIARNAMLRNEFTQIVQPHLDALSEAFGITSIGVQVVSDDHMVVVAISRSRLPFRLQVDIGSRFPALISATGRCVAAFGDLPRRELKRRFETFTWDNPPTFDRWTRQVEETRLRGYGIDDGEYIGGIKILSAPIRYRSGAVSHCIVSVGVAEQLNKNGVDPLADRMVRAAGEIAATLYN